MITLFNLCNIIINKKKICWCLKADLKIRQQQKKKKIKTTNKSYKKKKKIKIIFI